MDWQPIETAPKDGTPILIASGKSMAVAFWFTNTDEPYWAMDDGHDFVRATRRGLMAPTHWVRIEPPKDAS